MSKTSMYRSQHQELLRLAERIPVDGALPSGLEMELALARLKGVLGVHLKLEDDSLYPAMLSHPSPEIREKAERYQREMGPLNAVFQGFYAKWTTGGAIDADPQTFKREWFHVRRALQARIDAEESDLYELVDAAARTARA